MVCSIFLTVGVRSRIVSGFVSSCCGALHERPRIAHPECAARLLAWDELRTTDWQETNSSDTRTCASAAGNETGWGRVWSVMRILSEIHGADNVRLAVWFH